MHKQKNQGKRSLGSKGQKQTAGQTDPTYCITVLTNAVGNELLSVFICIVFNNS